jgi:hypothetical protein
MAHNVNGTALIAALMGGNVSAPQGAATVPAPYGGPPPGLVTSAPTAKSPLPGGLTYEAYVEWVLGQAA